MAAAVLKWASVSRARTRTLDLDHDKGLSLPHSPVLMLLTTDRMGNMRWEKKQDSCWVGKKVILTIVKVRHPSVSLDENGVRQLCIQLAPGSDCSPGLSITKP